MAETTLVNILWISSTVAVIGGLYIWYRLSRDDKDE